MCACVCEFTASAILVWSNWASKPMPIGHCCRYKSYHNWPSIAMSYHACSQSKDGYYTKILTEPENWRYATAYKNKQRVYTFQHVFAHVCGLDLANPHCLTDVLGWEVTEDVDVDLIRERLLQYVHSIWSHWPLCLVLLGNSLQVGVSEPLWVILWKGEGKGVLTPHSCTTYNHIYTRWHWTM